MTDTMGTGRHLPGTNNPTFVIQCDGVYYVTQSLAVYDPNKVTNPTQENNIALLKQILSQGSEGNCICAKVPQQNNIATMQQTSPDN